MGFLRRHLSTVVVAMVTAMVTAAAPAVAGRVVDYARNAGKVDGLDASQLVAAGVHTVRPTQISEPVIDDSFNYVNTAAPTLSGTSGTYDIDFGFDMTGRFALCSLDSTKSDQTDAVCSVSVETGTSVRVRIWDTGTRPGEPVRAAEFTVLVFGS